MNHWIQQKIRTIGFMDTNPAIRLEMVPKKEGSVSFHVTRYLMKGLI